MPRGDADQRQLPRRRADRDRGDEARQTDLQRRAEAGRRGRATAAAATRSTAGSRATRRSRGPTCYAVAQGRIAVTPIHFDLTDHGGLERLRGWGFEEMLAASATGGVSDARAEQRAAELRQRARPPQPPLLRPRRPRDRRRRLRRAARRAARDRGRAPRAAHARLADPAGRGAAAGALRAGRARRADALARQRPQRGGAAGLGEPARQLPEAARHHRLGVQLHDRAEDRRPGDHAHLRGRRAGPRRHPRRRPGRRGRDPEPAHDRLGAAADRATRRS